MNETLDSVGLSSNIIFDFIENAYKFEKKYFHLILNALQQVNWDTKNFLFGTIKQRVEW
jgi:hypothetical protein